MTKSISIPPRGWRAAHLAELVYFQRGFDITKDVQKSGDVPVLSSSGIQSYHCEAKAQGPGVVIGRKGSLGTVHYIQKDYWPHDTTLWSKDFCGNYPKFVYYYLMTMGLKKYDVGSSNPTLNRNHIHGISILIPSVAIQQKIASILSAYDDLIENNRRRIQLLEESARQLYKEWFVRLHFPGHEHVKVVDGVPEGWERKTLEEVAPFHYGKALTAENRLGGDVPVYASSGHVGMHNKALVKAPGIVIGRKGNVGSVYWVNKDYYPIDTTYYINTKNANLFLYYAIGDMNFISTDVAVPGLNRDYAHSKNILVPDKIIISNFLEIVTILHSQIDSLNVQNNKLTQARDLLLPKLMSGEVAV